jgi:nucleotide-binding universal stress UspA family protein
VTDSETSGRVVVGIDGSAAARQALHLGIQEAQWRHASVVAVMVIIVPSLALHGLDDADAERLKSFSNDLAQREIDEARERYGDDFPVPVELVTRVGHPGDELIQEAGGNNKQGPDKQGPDKQGPAELLILGSRGLGGFRGLLLGSVTTYVAHHPPCPLMIVRPTDDDLGSGDPEE